MKPFQFWLHLFELVFMFSDYAELSMVASDVNASFSTSTEIFSAEDSQLYFVLFALSNIISG